MDQKAFDAALRELCDNAAAAGLEIPRIVKPRKSKAAMRSRDFDVGFAMGGQAAISDLIRELSLRYDVELEAA